MSEILVTGGLGFIGHNVVQLLEKHNHECLVIDSCTTYGIIPQTELDFLINERKQLISSQSVKVDIKSYNTKSLIQKFQPDTIIHLASFPRQKVVLQNPTLGSDVMITSLLALLETAKENNVKKFVYISSSMVYGDFKNGVDELSSCRPIGAYAIMKYAGEKLLQDFANRTGISYTIIRPSAVYGERDVNDRVIAKFMISAIRNETLNVRGENEILDFTYVNDLAYGIVTAATEDIANNKIYNMTRCNPKLCTLLNAAEQIVGIAKSGKICVTNKDTNFPSRGLMSNAKARKDLDYSPKTNIEEGFKKYYDWLYARPFLWS